LHGRQNLIQCNKGCWRSPRRIIRQPGALKRAGGGGVLSLRREETLMEASGKGRAEE